MSWLCGWEIEEKSLSKHPQRHFHDKGLLSRGKTLLESYHRWRKGIPPRPAPSSLLVSPEGNTIVSRVKASRRTFRNTAARERIEGEGHQNFATPKLPFGILIIVKMVTKQGKTQNL